MELNFTKVNKTKFILTNPDKAIDVVNEMMNTLSLNKVNEFESNVNNYLKDTMLSRLVSTVFLNKHPEAIELINFITIDVQLPERTLMISCGKANIGDETKKLNGVLYR